VDAPTQCLLVVLVGKQCILGLQWPANGALVNQSGISSLLLLERACICCGFFFLWVLFLIVFAASEGRGMYVRLQIKGIRSGRENVWGFTGIDSVSMIVFGLVDDTDMMLC
jgi:hypothetical protein